MEEISLVFTSQKLVPVVWNPRLAAVLEPVEKKLAKQVYDQERKGGDRRAVLGPLPFSPGSILPAWEEVYPGLAESRGIALSDIDYIRGEPSDSSLSRNDTLLISSPAGESRFSVGLGMYTAFTAELLPLLWDAIGGMAKEEIVGIIPTGFEPEREGFGFAYPFTLVITTGRVIYAFLNDPSADTQTAYLNRLMKETGKDRQQVAKMLAGGSPAEAPWQGYLRKPLAEIFREDPINFFIPLQRIASVTITTGAKGDLLAFNLSSHKEQLVLDPGFGQLAYGILSQVLGNRVTLA
jgi:hypothetical protein